MWVIREYGSDALSFWDGYGHKPHQPTIEGFLIAKCLDFLSTASPDQYMFEKEQGGGFHTNKVQVVKSIIDGTW